MVESVADKVTRIMTIGRKCIEQSVRAIDHDTKLITEWMNKCIEDQSYLDKDADLEFSLGNESEFYCYAFFTEMNLPSEKIEDTKKDTGKIDTTKIEESVIKKYSEMSFKELKEQCNRFGICCSGLRNDYFKKLVTYELSQQGITPSHPISVPPRLNITSSPNHKPVQCQPVIFPKLNPSPLNTLLDKPVHPNPQNPPSSTSPTNLSKSIHKMNSSLHSPSSSPVIHPTLSPTIIHSSTEPPSKPVSPASPKPHLFSPANSPPASPIKIQPLKKNQSPSIKPPIPHSPIIPSSPPISPSSSPPGSPLCSPRMKRQGIHRSPAPPISSPRSPPLRELPQSMHSPSPPASPQPSKHTPASPLTKPTTPPPPPPTSTTKSNYSQKMDTIEDKFKRPQIPTWARNPQLFEECVKQHRNAVLYNFTPDCVFTLPETMDLEEVLGIYLRRSVNQRGSSANWTEEVLRFKEEMMEVVDLSDDGIGLAAPESEESSDSWYSLLSE